MTPVNWHLYIILCSDESLYTGITTDIEKRFRQHASGKGRSTFVAGSRCACSTWKADTPEYGRQAGN